MTHVAQYLPGRIDYSGSLHRAEIDGRPVVNPLCGKHHAPYDVTYIRPVSDLIAVTPNLERVLLDQSASNHRDDGVVLNPPFSVNSKEAARGRLHAELATVGL